MLRQVFAARQHRALLTILQAMVDENYYNRLGGITLPCTVVYGARDKTTPAHHSEALQRGIAKSRLKRIEKAGHMLNWEAPETVAEVIQSIGTNTKAPVNKAAS
jgi:pimeloyl-ACP methyl ester carboxylesterase